MSRQDSMWPLSHPRTCTSQTEDRQSAAQWWEQERNRQRCDLRPLGHLEGSGLAAQLGKNLTGHCRSEGTRAREHKKTPPETALRHRLHYRGQEVCHSGEPELGHCKCWSVDAKPCRGHLPRKSGAGHVSAFLSLPIRFTTRGGW